MVHGATTSREMRRTPRTLRRPHGSPGAESQSVHTIGVDTGGTFTDLVRVEGEDVRVEKLPSTPDDPSRAVLHGVERLGGSSRQAEVVHGTTVALNALLTGEVAPTALVINEGFADLIEIGRQERPELYALEPRRVAPIVERARRFEVDLRLWPDGAGGMEVTGSASEGELERLAQEIASSGAQAVSICLLHSYADPSQERLVGRALEGLGIPVTLSSSILPEYREVERFSTACVNASLSPLMGDYLRNLQESLPGTRLSILQSTGGTIPAARAAREPARILLSGPAGGVVGAAQAAREAGLSGIITLDMGGTSTDVAFHDSSAEAQEAVASGVVAGHAIGLPSLDVHTIGCGGGSIVRVDAGGILRVGPESAGADPGPICYGRGTELTVTDAHVALGHISCGAFVGGSVELDGERVERAFEELGARLGITPTAAALAVLEVARAAMRRAIGVRTMQRRPRNRERQHRERPCAATSRTGTAAHETRRHGGGTQGEQQEVRSGHENGPGVRRHAEAERDPGREVRRRRSILHRPNSREKSCRERDRDDRGRVSREQEVRVCTGKTRRAHQPRQKRTVGEDSERNRCHPTNGRPDVGRGPEAQERRRLARIASTHPTADNVSRPTGSGARLSNSRWRVWM